MQYIYKKLTSAVFVTCLGLSHTTLHANEASPQLTKSNNVIKQALMDKLKPIEFFSANFSQQVLDTDGNLIQKNSGNLVVSKPNKVYWKVTQPEESLIVSDGKTLWLFDPFIEQASAYSLTNAVANTPILLLSSEDERIWQQYDITQLSAQRYQINARDQQSQVKSLILSFKGKQLNTLEINDATGQKSLITLTDIDQQTQPNAELFKFTVPEGIYLDDQR